jgi:hypothetical protein
VRLRARTLAITAAALALVTPQLAFALNSLLSEPVQQSINAYDPLHRLSDVGVLDLLLTGFYPAITWMSFVIAGMALARLDLSQAAVQWRLAALGAALTVAAYGMSLPAGRQGRVGQLGGGRAVVRWLRFDVRRLRVDAPRYVFRGPARGPLASGPGMAVPPCRRDDLGGGATGPERRRWRR